MSYALSTADEYTADAGSPLPGTSYWGMPDPGGSAESASSPTDESASSESPAPSSGGASSPGSSPSQAASALGTTGWILIGVCGLAAAYYALK